MRNYYNQEIESERYQADIYVETYYNKLLAYEGYKSEAIDLIDGLSNSSRLLDVGCGTGWFLKKLAEKGWSNFEGLDISRDMLAIARILHPGVNFHETAIEEVAAGLGQERYDVLTCLGTLHHMPDLVVVANKLFALLKPGGILLVHEPNDGWFYEKSGFLRLLTKVCYAPLRLKNHRRIKNLRAPWKDIPESPHHGNISVRTLRDSLKEAGFLEEKTLFNNTLMRVLEGMLFRECLADRSIYRLIRKLDQLILDPLAGHSAGGLLMFLKKPMVAE